MKIAKNIAYLTAVIIFTVNLIACTSPEDKAANYLNNAHALLQEGKLKKAEIEYKNALQVNQNLPDAWYGLAKINERRQQWRKAYAVLNKIRELAPRHVDGRIMLAQMLLASNQIEQALEDAKEIIELAPDDARAHALMAAVQFRLENFAGAHEEVDKALAIDVTNSEAILVQARLLIAEKKYNEALNVLDKALTDNPENLSFYLMKIQAYRETNDKKQIEAVYLSLIDRFPKNNSFKKALVRQYVSENNVDAAENIMEQIVQADPANVDEKLRFVAFKNQFRSSDAAVTLLKSYIDSNKEEYRYSFLLGELYEAKQKTDLAKNVYQTVIDSDGLQSNGLQARNKLALIELGAGNRDQADLLVKEVLEQDKNNENALLYRASSQITDKKYDEALVSARTVLRDNPDSVKALGLLGQAYDAKGSTELAIESYTKAFQLSPGTPLIANQLARQLIRKRKYANADEVLQESISKGNQSLAALTLLAQTKLSLGEWGKAEQLAKQLQERGQEALSQQLLGVVYQGQEQQDESIDAFKRAYELAPSSAQPIISVVRSYLANGRIEDARRFLNSVLSVHSDNVTAYLLLGELSFYEKKTPEAIKYFQKVIDINPKLDGSYRSLASIYIQEGDYEKAVGIITQGLEEIPGRPMLVMFLASVYERQGNFSKAIETYESLLAENPESLVARNNLASLLTDYVGDQTSLEKARTISTELRDSQIPQFRDTYAWAAVKSGNNIEEAVVILEGIVKDNDQVDVYNYHLGEAYRVKGDTDNAIAYLKKAVELAGPGSDIANQANQSLQQIN